MANVLSEVRIDDSDWLRFVEAHPSATPFHHPAWATLLADYYGYRSFAVVLRDDAGEIIAVLPMIEISGPLKKPRWVSLPFTDYCSFLSRDGSAISLFTDSLLEVKRQHRLSELQVRSCLASKPGIYQDRRYVLHSLALCPDPRVVFDTFNHKFRQYARKAEREGLHTISTETFQDLEIFYAIHLKNRVKLGVPIQPKRFFVELWNRMISRNLGKIILVADTDNRPVSGAIILNYKTNAMIKYSASDPAYLDTRCHYFTFWKCIEWACLNGMSVIDFGKTDIPETGLRKFKDGWGAREEPLVYSVITDRPVKSSYGHLDRWMRAVIRHSPPMVCQVLGELLYRYAA